jgi:hypothetical protein
MVLRHLRSAPGRRKLNHGVRRIREISVEETLFANWNGDLRCELPPPRIY